MFIDKKVRLFLLSIPLILLFSGGVLLRSTNTVSEVYGCTTTDLSGILTTDKKATFEGSSVFLPGEVYAQNHKQSQVLGVAQPSDKWIEVDLSHQLLRAWDGNQIFLETPISSGLPGTPTPKGEFRVWVKLRATKMEGGQGRYYYYLPNVPYVMFFENEQVPGWRGYGIHGAYWHNEFGTPRSHGCVNVPVSIAQELYYWATPELPNGKTSIFSSQDNPGIRIVIHD